MKRIQTKAFIDATVSVPGSKSMTHRALITAALADGESQISGAVLCEDTIYTARSLSHMGAGIYKNGPALTVKGTGGRLSSPPEGVTLYLGNSGTSMRLLLSVAALGRGTFHLTGTERLCERPVEDLVRALKSIGAGFSFPGVPGYPPLTLRANGLLGGHVELKADLSSQFLSSLLLAAPYAAEDMVIQIKGKAVSMPYVNLTLDVMNSFGISVDRIDDRTYCIEGKKSYFPCEYRIEGDASSASYFWAAAAVTGGRVVTKNIFPKKSKQGDFGFLDILHRMGCDIQRDTDSVEVKGGPLRGISVDMGDLPDMVPTLAAVALFAHGKTEIRNVSHLRHKESDRLSAIACEWRRLGGNVEETSSSLIIRGGGNLHGGLMDPRQDHRIAMSLAVAGLKVPEITIQDSRCVGKSFPDFWKLWERL
jgi:3-phosphoshikimate 1-carboxyvinyltransferase